MTDEIAEHLRMVNEQDIANRERIADFILDAFKDRLDKFSNVTILDEDRTAVLVEFKSECYSIEVYSA